jgi:2-polyprenyl-6-methoxyphenol hydroxylase-like FAD-dependent oxidoreductase
MVPPWTVSDDVLGRGPERQVLVVGDGLVGRTVTAMLQRCGYEPVLAVSDDQGTQPAVVQVSSDAIRTLEELDVAGRIRDRGTQIDSVRTTHVGSEAAATARSGSTVERTTAVGSVIDAAALRRALAVEWPLERARTDRALRSVTTRSDGIEVAFADGVAETFDVVVDTTVAAALDDRAPEPVPTRSYVQHVGRCERDGSASQVLEEGWASGAVVQVIPDATGPDASASEAWVRVTTECGDPAGLVAQPAVAKATGLDPGVAKAIGLDPGVVADVVRSGKSTPVEQVRLGADAVPSARWGAGRIARCGRAAMPVAPAIGSGFSLGVRDAVAFVSELGRHDHSTTAAIQAYAAERHQAVATHQRRARHQQPAGSPIEMSRGEPTVEALTVRRTHALHRCLDSSSDHA